MNVHLYIFNWGQGQYYLKNLQIFLVIKEENYLICHFYRYTGYLLLTVVNLFNLLSTFTTLIKILLLLKGILILIKSMYIYIYM